MSEEIRPSILAGNWYPSHPEKLKTTIQTFLDQAGSVSIRKRIYGLICPHAGYIYSGQTAAYAYKQMIGREFETAVILSPMHHYGPGDYMVNGDIAYETPLGNVPIRKDLLDKLKSLVKIEEMFFDQEHAIEIHLPFLQMISGKFSILPIMVGHSDLNHIDDIVTGLTRVLKDTSHILIASSDMHHLNDYQSVQNKDKKVVEALQSFHMPEIRKVLSDPGCTVCGRVPMMIVLETAKRLGAGEARILYQTHSAEVTGNYSPGQYTVGYLSAAIC